jgi:drug/metabolite transporter (DMT)-like permease
VNATRGASRLAIWSALGTVYVVWGSTYLAIALVVQTLPPLLSGAFRFVAAALLVFGWLAIRRTPIRVSRSELRGAAIIGVLLLAGGNGMVIVAERTVPSGVAALIVASIPLWIVVYRRIAGETIGADLFAGVALGLAGVAVLVVPGGLSGTLDPFGAVLLLGATLSWSFGTFLSPRLSSPRIALLSTAYQMLAAGLALLVLALVVGEPSRVDPSTFGLRSILALAYLIVFGSIVAFTAYTWLLQHAPVSLVATYAFVNPVVAVVLGAIVLAEPITGTVLAGAAVIVVAVAFIVTRPGAMRHSRREAAPAGGAAD